MKKTLIAAAIAALSSSAVFAGSVTAYGLLDTSLSFVHSDSDIDAVGKRDNFTLENGLENGSRWGLRGREDLGNGLQLGFNLESGIESDTGAFDAKQGGRLFGREALISVGGDFGKFWFGRMHILGSVLGENGLFRAIDPIIANYTSAIGSGYATASNWTRVDNAISYRTPTFAGLTAYALYSFKMDGQHEGDEGHDTTDRYASVALRYKVESLEAVMIADTQLYGLKDSAVRDNRVDDGVTVTIGGNYTFDNQLKLITFAQYFEDQVLIPRAGVALDALMTLTRGKGYGFVTGFGTSLGMNYPVGKGVAKMSVNYRDMHNSNEVDFTRWTLAASYDLPITKRTSLYALSGYSEEKIETLAAKATPSGYQFAFGMIHKF